MSSAPNFSCKGALFIQPKASGAFKMEAHVRKFLGRVAKKSQISCINKWNKKFSFWNKLTQLQKMSWVWTPDMQHKSDKNARNLHSFLYYLHTLEWGSSGFTTLTITRSPMFCPNTNDPLEGFAEDLTREGILMLQGNTSTFMTQTFLRIKPTGTKFPLYK